MPRRKPCGKQTYKSRRTLLRVLENMKIGGTRNEVRAYFCRTCRGWHFTSQI